MKRPLLAAILSFMTLFAGLLLPAPARAASSSTVLIVAPTVNDGVLSVEGRTIVEMGLTATVVTDEQWRAMTTADFEKYRAIVFGDQSCATTLPQIVVDNASVWGAAITGNVIINGTDPVYHAYGNGTALIQKSLAFAVAEPDKTGLYVSLSCYYHGTAAKTPLPMLDGIAPGGFTVTGVPGCYDDVHVVAQHPAIDGLTDALLSNWGCSVHEAFDTWPADFSVLAMARTGSSFTAPDGTVGTPYILARGTGLRTFPLWVEPTGQTVELGNSASITVHLADGSTGAPVVDQFIMAQVTAGANESTYISCSTLLCTTDSTGSFTVSYRGSSLGEDTVTLWLDPNGNRVPDPGEPQVRAGVSWVQPTEASTYVAMGDSYSAGQGNEGYDDGTDTSSNQCHRSLGSYPRMLAKQFSRLSDLDHVACSGAVTADLYVKNPDHAGEPAQFEHLGAATEVVTLTIGGNDVGFVDTLESCLWAKDPLGGYQSDGRPGCSERNSVTNPVESRLDALAGKSEEDTSGGRTIHSLTEVITETAKRAPNARIFVGGYPRLFDNFGPKGTAKCEVGTGVKGDMGLPIYVEWRDAQWMNSKSDELNGLILKAVNQAKDSGLPVTYVPVSQTFKDHAICGGGSVQDEWIYGVVHDVGNLDSISTASFHPNWEGQRRYTGQFQTKGVAK